MKKEKFEGMEKELLERMEQKAKEMGIGTTPYGFVFTDEEQSHEFYSSFGEVITLEEASMSDEQLLKIFEGEK